MRVISIRAVMTEIVETDEKEWPTYRRFSPGVWENLMGESWESYYCNEELEAAYQAFRKLLLQ